MRKRPAPEQDHVAARPTDEVQSMNRAFRGAGIAAPPIVLLLALVALASCMPQAASPGVSPSTSPSEPQATPTATPRLPTPVPTVPPSSVVPGTTDPPASSAAFVIRLTTCSDTCGPVVGTTIMGDGQIVWQDLGAQILGLEARLTPASLLTVRDRIDEVEALKSEGNYHAQPLPGKEPLGRGTTSYRFEVQRGTEVVVVTSGEPADFASEPDMWIIPPEMGALAALAAQLSDPPKWLGANAFAEPAHRYVPARYLVVVDLLPGIGAEGEDLVDVDEIDWPFGNPIEAIGAAVGPGEDGPPPRCRIVDAQVAAATASAESAKGVFRDLRQWSFSVQYAWRRADGLVDVTLQQLLPHETGPCPRLVLTPP